jgi:hypothetical protein
VDRRNNGDNRNNVDNNRAKALEVLRPAENS